MDDMHEYEARQKSPEKLSNQISRVSETLSEQVEPISISREELIGMPINEIKAKFPRRYDMYLQALRADRAAVAVPDDEKQKMATWLRALNNLDAYVQQSEATGQKEPLQAAYLDVFKDLRGFLEQGKTDGYVKLPPSIDTTPILREFVKATNLKTIVASERGDKLDQIEAAFGEDIEVGRVDAKAKDFDKQVTLTTYHSLVGSTRSGEFQPNNFDLLILDDAHRALTPDRADTVKQYGDTVKIGLSPTPEYSQEKQLSHLLSEEIHGISTLEAAEAGLLPSFKVYFDKTLVDLSGVEVSSSGTFNKEQLARAVNIQQRNQAAVDVYKSHFNDLSGVAYCVTIEHAKAVAAAFEEGEVSATVFSSELSDKEREELLQRYRRGEIKMLCNIDIPLKHPKAALCLNLAPTMSPVVTENRTGGVLENDPDNPDKVAHIVDFVDKTRKGTKRPLTFAEVASGEYDLESRKESNGNGNGKSEAEREAVKVDGIQVLNVPIEVMSVTKGKKETITHPEGWQTQAEVEEALAVGDEVFANLIRHGNFTKLVKIGDKAERINMDDTDTVVVPQGKERVKYYSQDYISEIAAELIAPRLQHYGIRKDKDKLKENLRLMWQWYPEARQEFLESWRQAQNPIEADEEHEGEAGMFRGLLRNSAFRTLLGRSDAWNESAQKAAQKGEEFQQKQQQATEVLKQTKFFKHLNDEVNIATGQSLQQTY